MRTDASSFENSSARRLANDRLGRDAYDGAAARRATLQGFHAAKRASFFAARVRACVIMALPVQVRFEEPPLDLALCIVGESVAGAGKVLRDHALSPPLLGFD
jgi:hypothetical protein